MNKRLVTILGLCIMLATFHSVAWAQKSKNAFSDFQKRVEHMEKEANKDPETFVENVKELETYCSKLKDPVQLSVAHALLASSYETMSTSWVYRRSQDISDDFRMKRERHLSSVRRLPMPRLRTSIRWWSTVKTLTSLTAICSVSWWLMWLLRLIGRVQAKKGM